MERLKKAIQEEIEETVAKLRVMEFKKKNSTLASEVVLYTELVREIRDRLACLIYLQVIQESEENKD